MIYMRSVLIKATLSMYCVHAKMWFASTKSWSVNWALHCNTCITFLFGACRLGGALYFMCLFYVDKQKKCALFNFPSIHFTFFCEISLIWQIRNTERVFVAYSLHVFAFFPFIISATWFMSWCLQKSRSIVSQKLTLWYQLMSCGIVKDFKISICL